MRNLTVIDFIKQTAFLIVGVGVYGLVAGQSLVAAKEPANVAPDAVAATAADMKPYEDNIVVVPERIVKFKMVPIPGGKFLMGSPDGEAERNSDEGPQREVEIAPFWMGQCEVTWDEYEVFMFSLDISAREKLGTSATDSDKKADAVAHPTKPYTDMSFGMGKSGFPAISMTQTAAKEYCTWLSYKTGRYYRLPTEAEWEYACRAGTTTAYHSGDDATKLREYAWFYDEKSDDEGYHKVGKKKPNAWGLFDMHGNVAEWCLDQYHSDAYAKSPGPLSNPFVEALTVEPRVVRGGSWDDDAPALRSARRLASTNDWKQKDPQLPQSIWYYTDAQFLGFRIVRPLVEPSETEKVRFGLDEAQRTQPRE